MLTKEVNGKVSSAFPLDFAAVGLVNWGTIPIENARADASAAGAPRDAGPKIYYSGYLTINTDGLDCQVESVRHLASAYNDSFEAVLLSRGRPLVHLGGYSTEGRSRILHDKLNEFAKLGQVCESLLGIF